MSKLSGAEPTNIAESDAISGTTTSDTLEDAGVDDGEVGDEVEGDGEAIAARHHAGLAPPLPLLLLMQSLHLGAGRGGPGKL